MSEGDVFWSVLGGIVVGMVLFGILFSSERQIPRELCESIGENYIRTISGNEVQCDSTLIRIVPKENTDNEIKIISSDSIIGGE